MYVKDNFLTDSFITARLAAPGFGIMHTSACVLPSSSLLPTPGSEKMLSIVEILGWEFSWPHLPRATGSRTSLQISWCLPRYRRPAKGPQKPGKKVQKLVHSSQCEAMCQDFNTVESVFK